MDICPQCYNYTLEYDVRSKSYVCLVVRCGYLIKTTIDKKELLDKIKAYMKENTAVKKIEFLEDLFSLLPDETAFPMSNSVWSIYLNELRDN